MDCARLRDGTLVSSNYPRQIVAFSNWAYLNGFGPGMDKRDWPPGKTPQPQPGPVEPEPEPAAPYWAAGLAGIVLGVGAVYAYHHLVTLAPYRRRLARS